MTATSFVNGFHHVALKVHDFDAVLEFYKKGLGFSAKAWWGEGDQRAALLDAGNGNYVEVFAGGPQNAAENGSVLHLAYRTENCDAALAKAVAAGAVVTVEPRDVTIPSEPQPTPVRIAFCKGPAGEVIEFFQNELT